MAGTLRGLVCLVRDESGRVELGQIVKFLKCYLKEIGPYLRL